MALGRIGDRRALGPLMRHLDDDSSFVQRRVFEALEQITGLKYGEDRRKWRQWWRAQDSKPDRPGPGAPGVGERVGARAGRLPRPVSRHPTRIDMP